MSIFKSPSTKVNIREIKMNSEKFVSDVESSLWAHHIYAEPDAISKKITPIFIATHPVSGTFFFMNGPRDNLIGGKVVNGEDVSKITPKSVEASMKSFFKRATLKDEALNAKFHKTLDEISSEVLGEAESLEGAEIINSIESGLLPKQVASVYAHFYKSNTPIDKVLAKKETKYSNLVNDAMDIVKTYRNSIKGEEGKGAEKETTTGEKESARLGDLEYSQLISRKINEANKSIDGFWRKAKYNPDNPMQETVAEKLALGLNMILMGDSGIGKTYNPKDIAEKNNVTVVQINLDATTESAELIGKPNFGKNLFDGKQEVGYDSGKMVIAAKIGREKAKKGEGIVFILDEIMRVADMTPFISNLSIIGDEYRLETDKNIDLVKIETSSGITWMEVTDEINIDRQKYTMKDSTIVIDSAAGRMLYDGDKYKAMERTNREDLIQLHSLDFVELVNSNRRSIHNTYRGKEVVFLPERALSIIATTNVGLEYEVNMNADNALISRMKPVPVKAPPVDFMVRSAMKKHIDNKNWTPKDEKKVENVMNSFFLQMQAAKNNVKYREGQKVNFRMIDDVIKGITPDEPFSEDRCSVWSALRHTVLDFAPFDPELPAEALAEHEIVSHANSIIDSLGEGKEKKPKGKGLRPKSDDPENNTQPTGGAKI